MTEPIIPPPWRPAPSAKPTPNLQVLEVETNPNKRFAGNPNWKPGMPSPNPGGRPRGIPQQKAEVQKRMLDQAGAVIDVMLQKALEGDSGAAAIVLNRILPTLRPQSEKVQFILNADQSISKQCEQVLSAVSAGEIAPDVGQRIIAAIQALANVRAVEDLEQRIIQLEAKQL